MATLADGRTIRVDTILIGERRGTIHVQSFIEDTTTGGTSGPSYSLDNLPVMGDEGVEVEASSGQASDWMLAYHADPDHAETWLIACIAADPSLSLVTDDLTREVEEDGNGYLTRAARA